VTAARKLKLSITLSEDLVARIDREALETGNRSSVVERWLRRAERLEAATELERATIAYYQSLTRGERAEEEAISAASARAARRLQIDDTPSVPRRPPRDEEEVMSALRRGCLYWAELDKRRPVLVLSPDYRNEHASDVIVIPCSTHMRDAPTHVRLRKTEGGILAASVLKCEQITTLPKSLLGPTPLGSPLAARRISEVERGVLRAIGIPIPLE
jgi:mRNA-degrading endonuclease toxin of MazEF toxin-antitoxin module